MSKTPEIVERLLRYAGKERTQVTNPCITAREAIELADWMVAIIDTMQQGHEHAKKTPESIQVAGHIHSPVRLSDGEIWACHGEALIKHRRHVNSLRGQAITPADNGDWHFAHAIMDAMQARDAGPLVEALRGVIEWDKRRGFIVPYKVRDPIKAALAAWEGR